MPLSKVQLMSVPGGPGDFGAVQQGTGVTINAEGEILSQPATVTSLTGANGVVVSPGPNPGEFELSFGGAVPTPLESGTTTFCCSSAAPLGWTKVTSGVDNKAIRVVSGDGSGSGGTTGFTSVFASQPVQGSISTSISLSGTTSSSNWSPTGSLTKGSISVQGTSLNISQTGSHAHVLVNAQDGGSGNMIYGEGVAQGQTKNSDGKGSNGSHTHGFSKSQPWTLDSKPHTHGFNVSANVSGSVTGSSFNLAVKYIDAILVRRN